MMNKIFVICGPTSTGKTSLSLNLCQKFNGEIISADSRQLVKFMDIGTGKIPIKWNKSIVKRDAYWLLDDVKVWGYDLISPDQFFSSYDFAVYALKKIQDASRERKNIFIVGGTGFYIDTVTGRIRPSFIEPDFKLRDKLMALSLEDLQEKLKISNPVMYTKIDRKNKVRLIRALEKEVNKKIDNNTLPYLNNVEFIQIGLTDSRELLFNRADIWAEEVWNGGLVEETRKLLSLGYRTTNKLNGLIYKSVVSYCDGLLSEKEALERIKFDLHSYIRRQQTYFKKNTEIDWFEISKPDFKEKVYNFIQKEINNGEADKHFS